MQVTEIQATILQRATDAFGGSWECIHDPFPNHLYHYTSAAGLIGILSSKSFWLTDLRYMNDMSELQYAQQVIERCISDKMNVPSLTEIQKEFLSRISRTYSPFGSSASIYSASFCENGNLLSQWRAYRGQGGGYALGFDFFHAIRLLDKPCVLRKVIYDVRDQNKLVDDAVSSLVAGVGEATINSCLEDVTSTFLPAACQAFSALAAELLFCLTQASGFP